MGRAVGGSVEQSSWFQGYGSGEYHDRRILVSAGILSVLFLLDVLTTDMILSSGGIEYNPFMTGIAEIPIVHIMIKFLLLLLVVLAAEYSEKTLKGSGVLLFVVTIAWYLACVGFNIGSIAGLQAVP